MLSQYIKTAWRNTQKSVLYSVVNMAGLSIGIAGFILMLVYFNYETSYDTWDPALKNVYKISLKQNNEILQTTPAPLASLLKDKFSRIEAATAIQPAGDYEVLIASNDKKLYQKGLVTADSLFFGVFPYQLSRGEISTVLNKPNAIVISETIAKNLFGNQDPIGKLIKVFNAFDCEVTGVMKKPNTPSTINAEMIMRDPYEKDNKFWQNYSFETYVKTSNGIKATEVEKEVDRIYYNERVKTDSALFEQYKKAEHSTALFADQFSNLHNFPKHGSSGFQKTLILLVLAVFLLAAGSINFSNLALAKAITKAKDTGIRKVLGSVRSQVIAQSITEIALQCFISLVAAILIVILVFPWFSNNFELPADIINNKFLLSILWQISLAFFGIIVLAGLYPAIVISKYRASEVLKGKFSTGKDGVLFRNILLVVQLTISAFFIIGTVVVNRQINFMQHKDLGFTPSRVIRIEATQQLRDNKFEKVRNALLQVPGIEYVAKSTTVPGSSQVDTNTMSMRMEGKLARLSSVKVGIDYFKTLNIGLVAGRVFDYTRTEDPKYSAVINKAAAERFQLENPVGKKLNFPGCDSLPYTVVGVVNNFNVQGLESGIQPAVYTIDNNDCMFQSGGAILVKLKTDRVQQTLIAMENEWKKLDPDFPIRYSFLDQNYAKLLSDHTRIANIVLGFTIISIVISVIGLFALTSFLTQRRRKEVGIRKVLGGSVSGITTLLSKDFALLVLLAIVIATPIAWWMLNKWLENFAYKIDMSLWLFAFAIIATIIITVGTVCIQAAKAALSNPVKSLKSE